ncbi:28632_t:CDS:1, partial [Racocetra persica]
DEDRYLENERQCRELVQQPNKEFYGERTWMTQIRYHLSDNSNDEANVMNIDNEYLIDSLEWTDDELEFDSNNEIYSLGYVHNFYLGHNEYW